MLITIPSGGTAMFRFREKELARLSAFAGRSDTRAASVYGRIRTGKTTLILHALEQGIFSDGLYYFVNSRDYHLCLMDFKHEIQRKFGQDPLLEGTASFKDVFVYLSRIIQKPCVIMIDEFPFLARKDENVCVEFQWIIDHGLGPHKLILLGSSRSFMIRHFSNAPLHGRFDETIEVFPFTFEEVHQLFENHDDALAVYAATGGTAQYVSFFMRYPSVEEGMKKLCFDPAGRLYMEADILLMMEFRETSVYTRILRFIGEASRTAAQIAAKAEMDHRVIFAYLSKLIELQIVSVDENLLAGRHSEKRYKISDLFFRFHYSFISPNASFIASAGERSMPFILNDQYKTCLEIVYEDIIRRNLFLYAADGRLPFIPKHIGKWWGRVQEAGNWMESEVDIIAYDDKNVLVGECKHRTKKIGIKELERLRYKANYIAAGHRKVYYLLAGRSGFSDDILNAEDEDVILIDKTDIIRTAGQKAA